MDYYFFRCGHGTDTMVKELSTAFELAKRGEEQVFTVVDVGSQVSGGGGGGGGGAGGAIPAPPPCGYAPRGMPIAPAALDMLMPSMAISSAPCARSVPSALFEASAPTCSRPASAAASADEAEEAMTVPPAMMYAVRSSSAAAPTASARTADVFSSSIMASVKSSVASRSKAAPVKK
ncbi:hypothetical protein EON62_05330 [archaeon]|nr:MAG: hypothetical protein EON62_05330 [archaeon]